MWDGKVKKNLYSRCTAGLYPLLPWFFNVISGIICIANMNLSARHAEGLSEEIRSTSPVVLDLMQSQQHAIIDAFQHNWPDTAAHAPATFVWHKSKIQNWQNQKHFYASKSISPTSNTAAHLIAESVAVATYACVCTDEAQEPGAPFVMEGISGATEHSPPASREEEAAAAGSSHGGDWCHAGSSPLHRRRN